MAKTLASSHRDAALSGENHFTSLTAQDQYVRALQWMEPVSDEEELYYRRCLLQEKQENTLPHEAYMTLVHAYLPMVHRIAVKLWWRTKQRVDLMDLIQAGNIALLHALENSTISEGPKSLAPYLSVSIRGAIFQEFYHHHAIHIPASSAQSRKKQGQEEEVFRLFQTISFEQACEGGEDISLADLLEAPALILSPHPDCSQERVHLLALLLAELPARERVTLQLRYGLGEEGLSYTREETAVKLGVSTDCVNRYECHAMQRIRNLYEKYERETGRESTLFATDLAFSSYLEDRRKEHVSLSNDAAQERLQRAFTTMQQAGEPIAATALALRAGVDRSTAHKYLQKREHHVYTDRIQDIQARVKQAFTAMQEASEPITSDALALRAGVGRVTAWRYIRTTQGFKRTG